MKNNSLVPQETLMNKIIFVRGKKVIPDSDLAELYGVETKQLKRAVRRNIERFPDDFMFEFNFEEYESLRRQFGTLERGVGKLEITICDLKMGWTKIFAIYFY